MSIQRKIMILALLLVCVSGQGLAGETATLRNGFTIHYEHRETVGENTRLFLTDSADSFVDVPSNEIIEIEADKVPSAAPSAKQPVIERPVRIDEALSAASLRNHVSPELLRSVVRAESGFDPNARSPKGAQGLMQLMPATAARMGVQNVFDPQQNLDGGAKYLSELLGRYNNNLVFALAAYNAGPERVQKYHGVPPFPETVSYVSRVLRNLDLTQQESEPRTLAARRQLPQWAKRSSAPRLDAIRETQEAIARGDQQVEATDKSSEPIHSN